MTNKITLIKNKLKFLQIFIKMGLEPTLFKRRIILTNLQAWVCTTQKDILFTIPNPAVPIISASFFSSSSIHKHDMLVHITIMMIFNIHKTKALNKYENNSELILNFHDYVHHMSNYDSHACILQKVKLSKLNKSWFDHKSLSPDISNDIMEWEIMSTPPK